MPPYATPILYSNVVKNAIVTYSTVYTNCNSSVPQQGGCQQQHMDTINTGSKSATYKITSSGNMISQNVPAVPNPYTGCYYSCSSSVTTVNKIEYNVQGYDSANW